MVFALLFAMCAWADGVAGCCAWAVVVLVNSVVIVVMQASASFLVFMFFFLVLFFACYAIVCRLCSVLAIVFRVKLKL